MGLATRALVFTMLSGRERELRNWCSWRRDRVEVNLELGELCLLEARIVVMFSEEDMI